MKNDLPKIVISGINITEAGPLSILADCLDCAARELAGRYEIVALVHKASLVSVPGVRVLEYPDSKRSWLHRLYYEYIGFRSLSASLRPRLWLSLHDMSPNVHAERRAVYCHNAAPFYRLRFQDALLEPRFALFVLLYGVLYSINLGKNRFVVVQQQWMRREFESRFGCRDVIVAHPVPGSSSTPRAETQSIAGTRTIFFYPTIPRPHKNFEIIGLAAQRLRAAGLRDFEIRITIDGRENRYARRIAEAFAALPEVRLIGRQTRAAVHALYDEADCLIFPSRLESWGMPISEFKPQGKPVLVADCEYAAETVGDYGRAAYFDPDDAGRLAELMRDVMEKRYRPENRPVAPPAPPYARNWTELFSTLLGS